MLSQEHFTGQCENMRLFTLYQQVYDDCVKPQCVGGRAGVVPRILSFHRAQHQGTIWKNIPVTVLSNWDGGVLTVRSKSVILTLSSLNKLEENVWE